MLRSAFRCSAFRDFDFRLPFHFQDFRFHVSRHQFSTFKASSFTIRLSNFHSGAGFRFPDSTFFETSVHFPRSSSSFPSDHATFKSFPFHVQTSFIFKDPFHRFQTSVPHVKTTIQQVPIHFSELPFHF
ncbi:hypothetical protein AVEN_47062-1 [Araneus ventricosus]|uniref:Uncharacterized protein n=1 Tax=Araneus ventricosus TaxID=182803 RepID=A0A4Y2EZT9_ARAVE|nr:hypothetical protein AVEN_47062-1 [Araneus ventricosus]